MSGESLKYLNSSRTKHGRGFYGGGGARSDIRPSIPCYHLLSTCIWHAEQGFTAAMAPTLLEVRELLKPLLQKDLRNQCRARNLSPAGSREILLERLEQHIMDTGDL